MQLCTPILAGSQLSRQAMLQHEKRGRCGQKQDNNSPQMADL